MQNNDQYNIQKTINAYFQGMYHCDINLLHQAFHPNAMLSGYIMGNFELISVNDWILKLKSAPIPAQSNEAFDMKIISIDLNDTIALTKVNNLYCGLYFTDYLSLIRSNSDHSIWQITHKLFCHR